MEVTLPDWIPLTHWMANMRVCGCGPRAYTEINMHTPTQTHSHTFTNMHPCTHTPRHTHTHTVASLLKYELLSLVEYKRHFSPSSSLTVKSHVKSRMWSQTTCVFQTDVGFQNFWDLITSFYLAGFYFSVTVWRSGTRLKPCYWPREKSDIRYKI